MPRRESNKLSTQTSARGVAPDQWDQRRTLVRASLASTSPELEVKSSGVLNLLVIKVRHLPSALLSVHAASCCVHWSATNRQVAQIRRR